MATADIITQLYVGYYNRAPDPEGLNYWIGRYDSGEMSLDQIAQSFSEQTETLNNYAYLKYPNLGIGDATPTAFITSIYNNLFNRAPEPDGLDYWVNELSTGSVSVGKMIVAIIYGAQGDDATTVANKVEVGLYYAEQIVENNIAWTSSTHLSNAQATLAAVTADSSTIDTAKAAVDSEVDEESAPEAQTYTLTTGANTVTGGDGDDTIDGGTSDSWSAFDKIDGGDGADTMTVLVTGTSVPGASTVKNVETLNVNSTGAGYTIDTTNYTGLTELNLSVSAAGAISVTGATTTVANIEGTGASAVTVIGTGGDLSVSTGAGAVDIGQTAVVNALTSATVVGGTTVKISDNKTTAKADGTTLTTVSLDGNTGAATLDTDGLTTLNLTDNTQNVTVNAAAGTRALALTVDGATGGIIDDATATSVTVTASGSNSSGITLNAAAAKTVSVTADKNLTIADVNIAAATSLGIAGAGNTTLSAASTVTKLASVDASGATGKVTITPSIGTAIAFTGGSGDDSIEVGATTQAIAMGDGDDTVLLSTGVTALGSGGSIAGGDGTDTLAFTTFANAVTASASSTFAGTVSGFEAVKLVGANGAAGASVNMANLDNISSVEIAGNRTATATINNLASGGTVTFSVDQTNAQALTIAVKDAAIGTADSVNVGLKGTAAVGSNAITVNDVETINFVTDDTATTITNITHTSSLTADSVETITVAGDAGLNLTHTGTTVTSFDASGVTGGAVTWTTGALAAAATIVGSATRANTIDSSATNKDMTYTGGSGVDTVTMGNGDNTVTAGAGNDVIVVGNGDNTISAASGDNTITVGTGTNTITVGAGDDTIAIDGASAGTNTIDVGTGDDTVAFTTAVQSAAGYYASVTGMGTDDVLDWSALVNDGGGMTAGDFGSKVSLGGAASWANYLDATAAGDGSTNSILKWFQHGGNTYVVVDNSAGATFQDGADAVVELVGLIDLSESQLGGDGTLVI